MALVYPPNRYETIDLDLIDHKFSVEENKVLNVVLEYCLSDKWKSDSEKSVIKNLKTIFTVYNSEIAVSFAEREGILDALSFYQEWHPNIKLINTLITTFSNSSHN